jgi:phosphoglycerol transferase MdoB-like AlkP superfamily enzyme
LTFVDAKIFDQSYANNLVLNSTFTLMKSFGKPPVERIKYFDSEKMLSLLNQQDLPSTFALTQKRSKPLNVVYIFLESFSQEYTQLKDPEATPFFNTLRKKSTDFANSYANGRRSIEGVAALLSGIPALMEEPFINSEFSANQVIGLGTLLTAANYHTSFFHGAQNGSMHFDQFMRSVGIQNYFGKNEYPNQGDDDGTWGIFDEPFLQWTCEKLTQFPQPFFTSIFTLTSHQPFKVPEKYQDRFKDERLPILRSVQYTDYALQKFIECAEKQTWYDNTLFILTADHTGPELKTDSSFESRFEVPLLFYSANPEILKGLQAQQFAQHIDVLPTLLETLQMPLKNKNYLARSLWQPGPKVIALYTDGRYELVGQVTDEKEQLKAIQQYFSEGLFDNRLYYPAK